MTRPWGLLLLTLLVASPARAATHVIAVGNNLGLEDEPALRYAERDAQDLADVLRRLGRTEPENATVLLGEGPDDLRRILLGTNVRLRASPTREQGDVLIVYYSGHADAAGLHLGKSVLPYAELEALVAGSPAKVRLLIIDSCRSGGITQIKGAKPSPPFAIRLDQRLEAEGMAIITSSSGTEDSQESEALRASFFTHHLLTGLRGAADLDADGRVTLNEAYGYAYRATLRSTGRTARLQHPTYSYDLKGKGDFTLTFPSEAGATLGELQISAAGSYLVLEGGESGAAAAELTVEGEPVHMLLSPGRYLVRRRSDTSYREYQLKLYAGQKVELEGLDYDEVTYARLLRKGGGTREVLHAVTVTGGVGRSPADGYGLNALASVGYGIDFPWLTFGLELRMGLSRATSDTISGQQRELALRLRGERFLDLEFASVGLGLLVEGNYLHQSFETAGEAPSRNTLAFGFGGLVAIERPIVDALSLRLEGGIVTYVLPAATVASGAAVSSGTDTPLTWWVGMGGRWSL
ncbi:MAG: caspase family protein [Deltaproteobacteria bacterium]|nr:caspase family protein [Deltaproteobacteria bacterium]